jgi:hypothetical protein
LERAREQEAAETRLKIMEDGRVKLINLADVVQDEDEERSRDELIELSNDVLYNRDNALSMAQMLRGMDDPDITARAQAALDEANEVASNSCICINVL